MARRSIERFHDSHFASMARLTAAKSQRLALLLLAFAASVVQDANAHAASRLTSASGGAGRSSRRLHSVDDSAPSAAVTQIHSRKCGVLNTTSEQSQRVINAIAGNYALREQVRSPTCSAAASAVVPGAEPRTTSPLC